MFKAKKKEQQEPISENTTDLLNESINIFSTEQEPSITTAASQAVHIPEIVFAKSKAEAIGVPLEAVYNPPVSEKKATRGRPPKSPKRQQEIQQVQEPPPQPQKQQQQTIQSYDELRREQIVRTCNELRDIILKEGKKAFACPHGGNYEKCTIKELQQYRGELLRTICSGTEKKIIKSGYFLGLGAIEVACSVLAETVFQDNEMLCTIGALPPGTTAKAVKAYDESNGGAIDKDLEVVAIMMSDYLPKNPFFALTIDTIYALTAITNNPKVYFALAQNGSRNVPPTMTEEKKTALKNRASKYQEE